MTPLQRTLLLDGGFSPYRLPGLALRLDASVLSSLTYDGGGAVSAWRDLSGRGRHTAQATGAAKPILTIAGSGNYVTFDGTDDVLAYSNAIFSQYGDATVLAVVAINSTPALDYGALISEGPGVNSSGNIITVACQYYGESVITWCTDVWGPGGMADLTGDLSSTTRMLVAMKWANWYSHKTNGSSSLRINRRPRNLTAQGADPGSPTTLSTCLIGAFADSRVSGGSFANMALSELLVFNVRQSDSAVRQAEAFLAKKWGMA